MKDKPKRKNTNQSNAEYVMQKGKEQKLDISSYPTISVRIALRNQDFVLQNVSGSIIQSLITLSRLLEIVYSAC